MVYILLANGFEELEALAPYDILKRGGADVKFVSVTGNLHVKGTHGVIFTADMLYSDICNISPEMTVLPGGMPGMTSLLEFAGTRELLDKSVYKCAICASPSVLGLNGYLVGKKAVCYPGFEKNLRGADIVKERVVRDGNIITAVGAGASCEFGFELLAALKGKYVSEKVRLSMH